MDLLSIANDIDELLAIDCRSIDSMEKCKSVLTNDEHSLKVLTFNIRSYQRNFNDFKIALKRLDLDFDVVVLTECWLCDGIIFEPLEGYKIYQSLSQVNKCSGIVTYVKNSWNSEIAPQVHKLDDADSLLININNDLTVLGIYRSPSFSNTDRFISSLDSVLSDNQHKRTLVIAGDINININDPMSAQAANYLCLMASHGLYPAISKPTRGASCLDHIFIKSETKSSGLVCKSSITDHDFALAEILLQIHRHTSKVRMIRKTDWESVASYINSLNWNEITSENNVNTASNKFL
ncbi:unnamed protein product [Parnassius mnemosyne]|uniref:Endonuclease/exonuclease/phosphatase domain-containing protein n=1 Tax=Parnassius mnemosyne TaxID=213953 RepID=A0AAV1LGX1_9NEOP